MGRVPKGATRMSRQLCKPQATLNPFGSHKKSQGQDREDVLWGQQGQNTDAQRPRQVDSQGARITRHL